MMMPVVIALLAMMFLYAGLHDMSLTDALRSLLGRQPKDKGKSLSAVPMIGPNTGLGNITIGNTLTKLPNFASVNPVPGATGSRLDQGFDLTGSTFLSPFNGTVVKATTSDPGWQGGGYIAIKSNNDPNFVYFVAEGVHPIVSEGQQVQAGEHIGIPATNPYNNIMGNVEIGRANPASPGQPLAQVIGNARGMVLDFYRWIKGLGGPTATSTGNAGKP